MTREFIRSAFTGGVLAPELYGREDLEKFELALRQGYNWWVDYRGGISLRPPTKHIDFLMEYGKRVIAVPFSFNRTLANNYLLLFGDEYIAFVQDGEYIKEAAKTVSSITAGTTTTVNATSHGYSNGDWVKLDDPLMPYSTVIVANKTANAFEATAPDGSSIDTTGIVFDTGTNANKIYTITTPYQSGDLLDITFSQYRDELYISSNLYERRKLTRTSDTNWSLDVITPTAPIDEPSNLALTASAGGGAGVIYAVTAIDEEGEESLMSDIVISEVMPFLPLTNATITLTWDAVTDAVGYKVYRSRMTAVGGPITKGEMLGYLGETVGTSFADTNIVPDFTKAPPLYDDPFADEAVLVVNITNGGTGYAKDTTTVSISGGTGFRGEPVVDDSGVINAVKIINPGTGYSGGSVSFGGAGSGATATIKTSPSSGNQPNCSTRSQQRRIYAGTDNLPMTLFGSRVGDQDSFIYDNLSEATDPFELSLDAPELTPIRHVLHTSLGLLAFTASGIYHIRGSDDALINSATAVAEERTADGSSRLEPLKIGDSYLYALPGSQGVYSIQPSRLRNYYETFDRGVFSSHYFTRENRIISWCFAKQPHRQIWAVRQDGTLLTMTYLADQNVYAWTDHATDGKYRSVASIVEGNKDVVYAVVERIINGTAFKFVERFDDVEIFNDEDTDATDAFKEYGMTAGAGSVTPAAAEGDGITVTSSSGVFVAGDVGKVLRFGRGRATIVSYTSATEVSVDFTIPVTELSNVKKEVLEYSTWYIDEEITELTGLGHLEGESVEVIGDGLEQASKTVTDGKITIDTAASHIIVGINFDAELETLPFSSAEFPISDKKKRSVDVSIRTRDTRAIEVAASNTSKYYAPTDRTYEVSDTSRYSGIREVAVTGGWEEDAGIKIRKAGPFKASILGFVVNAEVGLD